VSETIPTGLGIILVYAVIGWTIRMLVYPPKTYKHAARSWAVGCLLAVMLSDPIAYYVKGFINAPHETLCLAIAGLLAMTGADLVLAVGKFLKSKIEVKNKDDNTIF
jgi:hypothetical protein